MKSYSRSHLGKAFGTAVCLIAVLATGPVSVLASPHAQFTFENAEITVVIAAVSRLTGTTFLFDPARVKGAVTVVAPADVTPTRALELLRSALALHGYTIVARPEGMWIVPTADVAKPDFVVRVVPLRYADAGEVASTLAWVTPPGLRVAPYFPTNSVVIAGEEKAVEQLMGAIRRR
jgi:type II secretory pathway component GspD/PulD (secretin)